MEPVPEVAPVDASNTPQQAEAEPMTDAETANYETFDAEVVLLVLSGPLVWRDYQEGRLWLSRLDSGEYYGVHQPVPGDDKEWSAEFSPKGRRYESYVSSSRSSAKAACERHHATGRWE